jgi:O-acetyl-ADP-ribose deacetylase (regulator of RNase III)
MKHDKMKDGEVFVSSGGKLKAKFVIHAIGPLWGGGKETSAPREEDYLLALSVYHSLLAADFLKIKSISIPAISSGKFGYPKKRCAKVLMDVALYFYSKHSESTVNEIRFTNFDSETLEFFEGEFDNMQQSMFFGDGTHKPMFDIDKLESMVDKIVRTSMDSTDENDEIKEISQEERVRMARLAKYNKK